MLNVLTWTNEIELEQFEERNRSVFVRERIVWDFNPFTPVQASLPYNHVCMFGRASLLYWVIIDFHYFNDKTFVIHQ